VDFQPKKPSYHHDESVLVRTPGVVGVIADLLKVKEETLTAALVSKRARASGETLVINYRMAEVRCPLINFRKDLLKRKIQATNRK